MKHRMNTQIAFLATALMLGMLAQTAIAQVTFHTDLASFQANSTTSVAVTFEGFAPTDTAILTPITLGGVTFTPIDSSPAGNPNLYVMTPGGAAFFNVPLTSNVLTASGNENFDMAFATAPTAVGFDTYTNTFDPPVVSVYDTQGNLLATYTLTQAPDTIGFLGITSTVPIGKVNWTADRGGLINTAVDNVRVGTILPHNLKFYLHGHDIPETAGGFTMNQDPAPSQTLALNLASAPSWFSDPTLTGTFLPGATFKLVLPGTAGLNLATTFRVEISNPDGSGAQLLGQNTQVLGLGLGPRTITIPVGTPVTFSNQRLKLTISSVAGLSVNLHLGQSAYLEATKFVGTP